jgi:oligosaccharide repeat unit polymerase
MGTNANSTRRDIGIICGCSVLLLLLAYRSPIILLIGTFLLSRLIQGRIRQRVLILGGVALVVFAVIIFSYRTQAIGRSISGKYVVPTGPFRAVPALFPLYIGFAREGTAIFARLHGVMPSSTPFMHGALQASMFHLHSGAVSPRQYVYDLTLGTNTALTTYTPPILGGPYIDFGFLGIVSEMFVIGLLSGWLYRFAYRDNSLWRTMTYSYWTMLVVLAIHTGLLDDSTLVMVPMMVAAAIFVANLSPARYRHYPDRDHPPALT